MNATTTWVSTEAWSEELGIRESESRWPGPRPLTEEDGEDALLVGRDTDLKVFIDNISFKRLTHLIGASGVGKTSLLMAGIIPTLRRKGYTVVNCRDWDQAPDEDFDVFLARALHRSLPDDAKPKFHDSTDIYYDLNALGNSAVVILDQFEELIRGRRKGRAQIFDFLASLIEGTEIVFVLSYRSEYVQLMKRIDRDPRIGTHGVQELLSVRVGAGRELITRPRRPADAGPDWTSEDVIESKAVEAIYALWSDAHEDSRDGAAAGLLHLQALLFVLNARSAGARITEQSVEEFCTLVARETATLPSSDDDFPSLLMNHALEVSATTRLDLAIETATELGMDLYLIKGIGYYLAQMLPHLSSGGFKLERQASDLAETVLIDDVRVARRFVAGALGDTDSSKELAKTIIDAVVGTFSSGETDEWELDGVFLLSANRQAIAEEVDRRLGELDDVSALGAQLWTKLLGSQDVLDVCAGPMMGLSPLATLFEQLRRFGWAVTWLGRLNLARVSSGSNATMTLTLIHDGFGDALVRWSERFLSSAATWGLYALTVPQGESHDWGADSHDSELTGTAQHPKLLVNLGLKGNSVIDAKVSNAVFVNCDFRGTLFLRCSFDAVTFLNCRLDGALFSDCTVRGAVNKGTPKPTHESPTVQADSADDDVRTAPVYILDDGTGDLARVFQLYRTESGAASYLLSGEPGFPAVPIVGWAGGLPFNHPLGGLTIKGSRISAMTFRSTAFHDDATLVFSQVRGSGLDLAELSVSQHHSIPRIRVDRSVLRHVAFTAQLDPRALDLEVDDSAIAQWWIGDGFTGRFKATNSIIGQMWVESSESAQFTAECTDDCVVSGLIGVKVPAVFAGGSGTLGVTDDSAGKSPAPDQKLEDFRTLAARMDYKR